PDGPPRRRAERRADRQMVGRVLRPADDKPDAVVLDHSGAVYRHGLPEDHVEWTLAVDRRAVNPAQIKRDRGEAPKLHECPLPSARSCSARRVRWARSSPTTAAESATVRACPLLGSF